MDLDDAKEQFTQSYRQNVPDYTADVEVIKSLLERALFAAGVEAAVSCRVKNLSSALTKYEEKYKNTSQPATETSIYSALTDLLGLRVIVPYDSMIEECSQVIRGHFNIVGTTDKTAALVKHGDIFGYKGLHLDCTLSQDRQGLLEYVRIGNRQFEIQVRSMVQHSWSELDHKLKYKKTIDQTLRRRIHRLAALFELADQEFDSIRQEIEDQRDQAIKQADATPAEAVNAFVVVAVCNEIFGDTLQLSATDGEKFITRTASEANRPITAIDLRTALKKHGSEALKMYFSFQDRTRALPKHAIPIFALLKNDQALFKADFINLLHKIEEMLQKP